MKRQPGISRHAVGVTVCGEKNDCRACLQNQQLSGSHDAVAFRLD